MNSGSSGTATLSDVLAAFESGAISIDDVAASTGLDPALVRLAVDQLVALGRLRREALSAECGEPACGGCALANPDGKPCEPSGAGHRSPVIIRLGRGA